MKTMVNCIITKPSAFGYFFIIFWVFLMMGQSRAQEFPPFPTFRDALVQLFADRNDDSTSYGAGFFVTSTGIFLTASHVIRDMATHEYYRNFRARCIMNGSFTMFAASLIHDFSFDSAAVDMAILKLVIPADSNYAFPYFTIDDNLQARGTQVVVAGFPKLFGTAPTDPVYRAGIISTYFVLGNKTTAVLDMTAAKGFSGAPVVILGKQAPFVLAVVRAFTGDTGSDFTAADIIPVQRIKEEISSYLAKIENK